MQSGSDVRQHGVSTGNSPRPTHCFRASRPTASSLRLNADLGAGASTSVGSAVSPTVVAGSGASTSASASLPSGAGTSSSASSALLTIDRSDVPP